MPETGDFSQTFSASSNVSEESRNLDEAIRRLTIHDSNEEDDAYRNPYPDRPGEPDCVYYMRTGLCGYGNNCRYNHPNLTGKGTLENGELPERVGQPDCQYFLKTGMCKFGTTCKYHHPPDRHDIDPVQQNVLGLPIRQDEKSCLYYMKTGTCKFGLACKFNHPQPATLLSLTGSPAYMPVNFPEIPDRPECQYYIRTGFCKYGSTCRYHHPKGTSIGPLGLPFRPGRPVCSFYCLYGTCSYGAACKFDHPVFGFYGPVVGFFEGTGSRSSSKTVRTAGESTEDYYYTN